jgi:RNA polymerase sigma-70 factor (ECF subfamily)
MSEQTDENLMEAYKKGEPRAFETLFDRYEKRLRAYFKKRLSPKQSNEADDFFQMTWLKVHNNRKSFDGSKKFAPWVYTIALNILRDHLRSGRAKAFDISFDENLAAPEPNETAEDHMIGRQQFEQIAEGLSQLSDSQKEIVLLSDWEGFGSQEIGQMLGLKDAAVRQQLSRARKSLQLHLKELVK